MAKPAAIITSNHFCPMITGSVPHVGGPILGPGAAGVFIDGQPAAVVGDVCTCCGPPDSIVQGAEGVLINGIPLAIQGSLTAHGGQIIDGSPGVLVGASSKSSSKTDIDNIPSNEEIASEGDDDPSLFTGCSENPLIERHQEDEVEKSDEYTLSSNFAHEQLLGIANDLGEVNFIAFMVQTFGKKISIAAYSKLYRALSDKKVVNVPIEVTKNRITGNLAAFSKKDDVIYVSETLLKWAIDENDKRGMLLTALTEEYGHYIDKMLRTEFSETENPDTDFIDAGAVYAYNLFFLDTFNEPEFYFADTESPEYSGQLVLNLTEIHTELKSYVGQREQIDMERSPDIDRFGAGRVGKDHKGSYGHQDILDVIINGEDEVNYFSSEEGLKIYYGNWLRDFSQVIVGSTIRLSKTAQQELKKRHINNPHIQTLLEGMPSKMSPEGMVRLVHIAAIKEFEYNVQKEIAEDKATFDYSFRQNEVNFNRRFGKLTPEILGAYRPEEHIDNPKKLIDESMLYDWQYGDRRIKLYKGKYDSNSNYINGGGDHSLDIDLKHGLKDYIINDRGHGYQSARSYMLGQLKEAMAAGRTTKGLRHFGAALHVLEDYFAHTNFTEVSLIKVGHVKVHPWVKFVYQTGFAVEGMHRAVDLQSGGSAVVEGGYVADGDSFQSLSKHIPIVTGLFGLDDTAASVLPKLANILFEVDFESYRKPEPGERTIGQVAIKELLEDLARGQEADGAKENFTYMGSSFAQWLSFYENYLSYLDFKAQKIQDGGFGGTLWEWHDRFFKSVGDQLTWFANFAFNLLLQATNEETADEQTLHSNKNYGTDPTHTQIAKDPPEHHFNPLAGELAKYAVKSVATEIIAYWNYRGDTQKQAVLDTAASFMVHPVKCKWQDRIVSDWAKMNPAKVIRGEDSTTVAHAHRHAQRKLDDFESIYKEINEYFGNK